MERDEKQEKIEMERTREISEIQHSVSKIAN